MLGISRRINVTVKRMRKTLESVEVNPDSRLAVIFMMADGLRYPISVESVNVIPLLSRKDLNVRVSSAIRV